MADKQDHWKGLRVTDDPRLEASLLERVDELSSRELADFAHSLGLFPPGYNESMNPPIAMVWPAGRDDADDGVLMWDARDDDEG